jgi:predicted PolB exonuclease-like 3'-5' exonuclease
MTRSATVLDFETIRCPKAMPFIPEKGPRDRTDPAEKLAFDPNYIQPCVAGFCADGQCWSIGQNDFDTDPERQLLLAVWDILETTDIIVTFNGWSFDLPLLLRRSWYHGIMPTKQISMKKYDIGGNHIDVRMVLGNWDSYARGNLDLYANLKLGARKTDGIDGSQVQGLWDRGEFAKVHEYCRQDCKITWDLYESLKGYYI